MHALVIQPVSLVITPDGETSMRILAPTATVILMIVILVHTDTTQVTLTYFMSNCTIVGKMEATDCVRNKYLHMLVQYVLLNTKNWIMVKY